MNTSDYTDAQLVALSRQGKSHAFAAIVQRYQSLVCSVAYNDCGSLGGSEEIGHDTFVAAWSQMADLREPDKLRSWLCAIARNLSRAQRRQQVRHTSDTAAEAESLGVADTSAEGPDRTAITREEESILWRALERIPPLYREPLILFYREGHSTAAVADLLGQSEEAVRQQLSRGRKRLQEEVAAFVEGALERSAPAPAFTAAVMGALPPLTLLAQPTAAAIGSSAGKGLAAGAGVAKIGAAGIASGVAAGLLGSWVGYKMGLICCRTPEQRALVRQLNLRMLGGSFAFIAAVFLLGGAAHLGWLSGQQFIAGILVLLGLYAFLIALVARHYTRRLNALSCAADQAGPRLPAYRSAQCVAGLPLLHIDIDAKAPARGWIAVSPGVAYGRLVAVGGRAVAPIAIGGLPVGLVALGGCPVGLVSLGGAGLGVVAVGGIAIGVRAIGACAIGTWATGGVALATHAASGEFAGAGQFAVGHPALALHANDAAARAFMAAHHFFAAGPWLMQHYGTIPFLAVAPLLVWSALVFAARRFAARKCAAFA